MTRTEKLRRIEATVIGYDPGTVEVISHTDGNKVRRYRSYPGFDLPDVPLRTRIVAELVEMNRSGDRRIRNWRRM